MIQSEQIFSFQGAARLSDANAKRTGGTFSKLIKDNQAVFERYFGVQLYPGSLNIDVVEPPTLQQDLDNGRYPPAFVIPRTELVGMPQYIGDGQTWRARLHVTRTGARIPCWIFRRIGSRVLPGVIEILAVERIRSAHGLAHGDAIDVTLFTGLQITDPN